MKFRTEYDARPAEKMLDPEKGIVLLGSCFSDSIGRRMLDCRWPATVNPCGVLYNPASIANILDLALEKDPETISSTIRASLTLRDGLCETWLMDSSVTDTSPEATETRIRNSVERLITGLISAQALIVTFGTAWVYELAAEENYIVSNCHKFPAAMFRRRRLTIREITGRWISLAEKLRSKYPTLRLIFTVSPIRHLKDGMEGNTRSKAVLQLTCEQLCSTLPDAEYFPAFEILNDDLRDYRFYAADLTHPSEQAVEYIWQKFCDRYLTPASKAILAQGEKATKASRHRPILPS